MTIAVSIVLGLGLVLIGTIVKVLLDYPSFRLGTADAPRALFRQAFVAPDLIMFAFGLLVTSRAIQDLLEANAAFQPPPHLSSWFWGLVLFYLAGLFTSALFWFLTGNAKHIPVSREQQQYTREDGTVGTRSRHRLMIRAAFSNTEGVLLLGFCNALGFFSVLAYAAFAYMAFGSA